MRLIQQLLDMTLGDVNVPSWEEVRFLLAELISAVLFTINDYGPRK